MTNADVNRINEHLQTTMFGPARDFAGIALDHLEKLADLQQEAVNAYADIGIKQVRSALDINDQAGIRAFVEGQQNLARTVGERVKGDADKVAALNQATAEKVQKAFQQTYASAAQAATSR